MDNYTRIIAGGTANIVTPTVAQLNAGLVQLAPLPSNVNNGFYNEMSTAINRASTELTNIITAAGGTPSNGDLTQVLASLNILYKAQATTTTAGASLLPSQIIISNNVTDSANDIDFSAGNFQFSDGTGSASLSALIKRLDATWAAGTNQGGLDTGTVAINATYHCFAIYNPTSGISDALFSASLTSPTMPSGYTKKKRIASFITNGSAQIVNGTYLFNLDGSYNFFYKTEIASSLTSTSTIAANVSLSVPTDIKVIATVNLYTVITGAPGSTVSHFVRVYPTSSNDDAVTSFNSQAVAMRKGLDFESAGNSSFTVLTNTSGQVRVRSNDANANGTTLAVRAFFDNIN